MILPFKPLTQSFYFLLMLGVFFSCNAFALPKFDLTDRQTSLHLFDHNHLFSTDWNKVIGNSGLPIAFGVQIGGSDSFSRNDQVLFAPASVTKMLTTSIALRMLQPEWKYETQLQWIDLGNGKITQLKIIGSGDPTWAMSEFNQDYDSAMNELVALLNERGVREIYGPISWVAKDPRLDAPRTLPEGWQLPDLKAEGTIPRAFNLDLNADRFRVTGKHSGSFVNTTSNLTMSVNLVAGQSTQIKFTPTSIDSYQVTGTWGGNTAEDYIGVDTVVPWLKKIFNQQLKLKNIKTIADASIITPFLPLGIPQSASRWSPPLSEILKFMNKKSINFLAHNLFLTIGSLFSQDEDLLRGSKNFVESQLQQTGAILSQQAGRPFDPSTWNGHFDIFDGSGLSHSNEVSTTFLMTFLEEQKLQPYFTTFWDSLAVAGDTIGTLRTLTDPCSAGRVRGKTGSLGSIGTYNLSGYVQHDHADLTEAVPFVFLTKSPSADYREKIIDSRNRTANKLCRLVNPDFAQ
jgi:D-alanyl-D-alanine carboxypeptidase/D-alanyl-D-alanine-endopeptidase (penicillin-binding protein 4)